MKKFFHLFVVTFVFILIVLLLRQAKNVHAGFDGYELRHNACNTYHILLGGRNEHVADFCGNSETIKPVATRKVKHSDSTLTPIPTSVTEIPPTVIVTSTPIIPVPPVVTESPVAPCQDDEDDGIGENDAIDDQEPEDCEDSDESQ